MFWWLDIISIDQRTCSLHFRLPSYLVFSVWKFDHKHSSLQDGLMQVLIERNPVSYAFMTAQDSVHFLCKEQMHNSLKFCCFLAINSTNLICFTNGKGTGKWLYLLRTSVSSAINKYHLSNGAGCISSTSLILFYHIFSHRYSHWKLVLIIVTLSSIKKPFFLFLKA